MNKNTGDVQKNFIRNTAGISSVELFWGLALPVLFESTFLQIFLKQIGASNSVIGLVPAILSAGIMLFGLVSAYFTSHLINKKRAVIITHLLSAAPWIIFGILLPFFPDETRVYFFLVTYIMFSLMLGLTMPVWQNFLVKIFVPEKTVRAMAIMMTVQIAGRFTGSLVIFKIVEKYAFSIRSASTVFIIIGLLMFSGSFFFLMINEQKNSQSEGRKRHSIRSLAGSACMILHDRNYLVFLYSFVEPHSTITIMSFYANYAVEFRGINHAAAAGLFAGVIYTASFMTNILLGWMDILPLKLKFITARIAGLAGTAVLLISNDLPVFLAASFLFGVSRSVNQFGYAPAVKKISRAQDTTDIFAISSMLIFPFAFCIPLISGLYLDSASGAESSYRAVFIILSFFQAAGLAAMLLTDFEYQPGK